MFGGARFVFGDARVAAGVGHFDVGDLQPAAVARDEVLLVGPVERLTVDQPLDDGMRRTGRLADDGGGLVDDHLEVVRCACA